MSKPIVSVVLPTHNGARYLAKSIESVIAQTFHSWELIIVDDASSDATPEIVARFCNDDSRIKSIRHETNRRLPGALNTGFAAAIGEFLTWTSDDNLYRREALAEMALVLDGKPEIGLVYADCTEIDLNGDEIGPIPRGEPARLPFTNSVGACFLYRRRVAEEVGGYREDLFLAEDYDYWLRASTRFALEYLRKDLYLYRRHPGSLSSRRTEAVYEAHERTLLQNLPVMTWIDPSVRAAAYVRLAMRAARCGQGRRCCRNIWNSVKASRIGCFSALCREIKEAAGKRVASTIG